MAFYGDRPLIFAHRGASHEAPQNTLAAFLRAAELGADGIELDVQFSRDNELVVIHDFDLAATTDGQGPVRDRTLAQLKELDAGGWFGSAFVGQRIPTLQEVVDNVGQRLLLNIELKAVGLGDGGLAASVARLIESNDLVERVVVSSFNPLAIWRLKRLNPAIPIGLLYAPDLPWPLRRPWMRHFIHPQALHPHHSLVDEEYVAWARQRGYRVNTWTVDEPQEMRRLADLGVDMIISNRPDLAAAGLGKGEGQP